MATGLLSSAGCGAPVAPPEPDPIDVPTVGEEHDVSGDITFASTPVPDIGAEDVEAEVIVDSGEEDVFEPECEPNVYCLDGVAGVCTSARFWQPTEDCGAQGLLCVGGSCRSSCDVETDDEAIAGCEHWGVGVDHGDDGPFAMVALNVSTVPSTVAVWGRLDAELEPTVLGSATLWPGEVHAFPLPSAGVHEPGVHWGGFQLKATAPVIAYQHSPLAGLTADSADGALVLPAHGMGNEFVVIGRPEGRAGDGSRTRGTLTVVAGQPGTLVTITPSVLVDAGAEFGELLAGEESLVALQPHQVLHLTTTGELEDLSGSVLFASQPVAVFTGHEADPGAVDAPYGAPGDHLEDALRPLPWWGTTHVAVKTEGRGDLADALVIVAASDETLVQFDPPLHPDLLLNKGEVVTRQIQTSVVISASRPLQVAQLTAGAEALAEPPAGSPCLKDADCATAYACEDFVCALPSCFGALDTSCPAGHLCDCPKGVCRCDPVGDAAWWVLPPAGQFEATTSFLAPITYPTHRVALTAPPGTGDVTLDGEAVAMEPVGAAGWRAGTVEVASGPHRIEGDGPVGVVLYGFGRNAGYGHAGGQALRDLRGEPCVVDGQCPAPDNGCFGGSLCDTTMSPARCGLTAGSAVTCEAPDNPCIFAICSPQTGTCGNVIAPDGTPCPSEAMPCAVGVCSAGDCVNAVVPCDDGVFCNGAEVCDAATNTCQPGPDPPIDDGLSCTVDVCDEDFGVVHHIPQPELCDDGYVCNGEEVCDVLLGCIHQTLSICDDGVFCNGAEDCDDVSCIPGPPPTIDDDVPCTLDACNEAVGAVVHVPDHGSCDDDNPCTVDTCDLALGCVHIADTCDDGDACTEDSCDGESGCTHEAVDCDDNDACTADSCDPAISCVYTAVVCDDDDPCTPDFCLAANGCVFGAPCDDGDACTVDGCDGVGDCTFEGLNCEDNNPCTTDSCDVVTGCSNINLCDDGNACTTDGCTDSSCIHDAVDCDDDDLCTTDECAPLTGCSNEPLDCQDEDPCTVDACAPLSGCSNEPLDCDDANACTEDLCDDAGSCAYTATDCDDGVACTADTCHSDSGCENLSPCDDGLACTVDACLPGGGCEWSALNCDDDDPCTEDDCDPFAGCYHVDTCGGG